MRIFITLLFLIFLHSKTSFAQQKNISKTGKIQGLVQDTTHKYALRSATVSISLKKNSSIVNFGLTNTLGEFSFDKLPIEVPMLLTVSHVGYRQISKTFTFSESKTEIDLGTLGIGVLENQLEEVSVSIAPIRLNGDTLEFNPAAFKLDSNAVVEDYLRKIPNITIWGDGTITVNGKDVKKVLVNGKKFFSDDPRLAIQNLPKNTVEKIQVYNKRKNENDLRDSTLEMDIRLKKGKDFGHFGKIGVGYGSRERAELDGSMNFFNSRFQLSIIGAANNSNKIPKNVDNLISYGSFKGVGARVDYMPNFQLAGINTNYSGGFSFRYDFKRLQDNNNQSLLQNNFFRQDLKNNTISNTTTSIDLSNGNRILEDNLDTRKVNTLSRDFNTDYTMIYQNQTLIIKQFLNSNNISSVNQILRNSRDKDNDTLSVNNSLIEQERSSDKFGIEAKYISRENSLKKQMIKNISLEYKLNVDKMRDLDLNKTDFISLLDASKNQSLDRKYAIQSQNQNQNFSLVLPKFKNNFYDNRDQNSVNFDLTNNLYLSNNKSSQVVEDFRPLLDIYQQNKDLTNKEELSTLREQPGVRVFKSFSKMLSNRFKKEWNLSLSLKNDLFLQKNRSQIGFQNLNRSYNKLIHGANFEYQDNQYGRYKKQYSINYSTGQIIPTVYQLVPLLDSTNLYFIKRANPNLKASGTKTLSFSHNYNSLDKVNALNYNLSLVAAQRQNNLTDSIIIDRQNIRNFYTVNEGTNQSLTIAGTVNKVLKIKSNEFQIRIQTNTYIGSTPNYYNSILNYSRILNTNNSFSLNYSLSDKLASNFRFSRTSYRSKQQGINNDEFKNINLSNAISISYNLSKRFNMNTNSNFNNSNSNNGLSVSYVIWNAGATYRLMKGNNLELKLTALDLLNQNTSIVNRSFVNGNTIGVKNVLKQYFMFSTSYFPRRFGKK